MTVTQALLAFTVVAGLLTVVPGMDTALVLRSTLTRSRRHGFAALGGIQVGTLLWGAAAAGGAAALLAASQTAYRVLTIAGAAYLVWMGVSMIAASLRRRAGGVDVETPPAASGRWRDFGLGLGTNLMNPKVGLFYVAAIPQFTPPGVNSLLMGLLLATVHCVLGTVWLAALLLGAARAGPHLRRSNAVRWLDRVTGGLLVALGARLAFETRA